MTLLVSAIAKPATPVPERQSRPPLDTPGPPSANVQRLLADTDQPEPAGPGFQSSI